MELAQNGVTEPPVGSVLVQAIEAERRGERIMALHGALYGVCAEHMREDPVVVNAMQHFASLGDEDAMFALGVMGLASTRTQLESAAARGNAAAKAAINCFGANWSVIFEEWMRLRRDQIKAERDKS